MYQRLVCTLLLVFQCTTLSTALISRNSLLKRQSGGDDYYTGPLVPSYNISIPVDHFNASDKRTYNNRYWVNDTYYQPGGPLFFFDNGEEGVSEGLAAEWLAEVNTTSAVMRLAERYNGTAVLWEHRYFGMSYPIPLNMTTEEPDGGIDGYKYLTIEQALEDVVYFANNWKPDGCSGDECSMYAPSSTPWIFIGGSYPGIRAAFMRIRNPEIIYASWASSAPVEAMYDGSSYFDNLELSLPSNCSADLRAVISYVDETMSGSPDNATYRYLQNLTYVASGTEFNISDVDDLDFSYAADYTPFSVAEFLATSLFADFQGLGPPNSTDLLCTYLESYNPNGKPGNTSEPFIAVLTNPGDGQISDAGIAATYNVSVAVDAVYYAARRWWDFFLHNIADQYLVAAPEHPLADTASWEYLVLTEFGWFQGSDPDNVTIISKFFNYTAVQKNDIRLYDLFDGGEGPNVTAADFPVRPNATTLNHYGGWNMTPSNVMFTDGQYDPWQAGTVMSERAWLGAPQRNLTKQVPTCNKAPSGTDLFGLVYPGAAHVPDLRQVDYLPFDDTSPVYNGLQLFMQALDVWLPCFNSSSNSSSSSRS